MDTPEIVLTDRNNEELKFDDSIKNFFREPLYTQYADWFAVAEDATGAMKIRLLKPPKYEGTVYSYEKFWFEGDDPNCAQLNFEYNLTNVPESVDQNNLPKDLIEVMGNILLYVVEYQLLQDEAKFAAEQKDDENAVVLEVATAVSTDGKTEVTFNTEVTPKNEG